MSNICSASAVHASVTCSLTRHDLFKYRLFLTRQVWTSKTFLFIYLLLASCVVGLTSLAKDETGASYPFATTLVTSLCIFLIMAVVFILLSVGGAYLMTRVTKLEKAARRYDVMDEGLYTEDEFQTSLLRWTCFSKVLPCKDGIYLILENRNGLVIPDNAFERDDQADLFLLRVKERVEAAR